MVNITYRPRFDIIVWILEVLPSAIDDRAQVPGSLAFTVGLPHGELEPVQSVEQCVHEISLHLEYKHCGIICQGH